MDDLIAFLRTRLDETAYAVRWCDEHGTDLMKAMQGRFPVLADVDAKRRIIDLHEEVGSSSGSYCGKCVELDGDGVVDFDSFEWPCRTLRLLALPYAEHPDYRDEWRP